MATSMKLTGRAAIESALCAVGERLAHAQDTSPGFHEVVGKVVAYVQGALR